MIPIGAMLALIGSSLVLLAAIGLVRLPDALARSHALAKAATLGIVFLLLPLGLATDRENASLELLVAVVFQFLTIPVASHLIARMVWRDRVPEDPPKP